MENGISHRIDDIINIVYKTTMNNFLKNLKEEELTEARTKYEEDNDIVEQPLPHLNIICSNCFKPEFTGIRFLCSQCNNYNLCEKCEELRIQNIINHNENHVFLRINKPKNIDINKYDNLIQGNNQKLKLKNGKGYAKVNIINSGIESFKNCYLSPICYGSYYITGKKIKIEKDIERGDNIDLIIELEVEENEINSNKQYISIWRMFTEEGIPFGKIISLFLDNMS